MPFLAEAICILQMLCAFFAEAICISHRLHSVFIEAIYSRIENNNHLSSVDTKSGTDLGKIQFYEPIIMFSEAKLMIYKVLPDRPVFL